MKELRCIVFTNRELMTAIMDRRRKLKEPPPDGEITGMRLAMGEKLRAIFELDGGEKTLEISEQDVQAALVSHCMAKNVPLPVEADKSVYLIKGHATLMITMNFNKQPRLVGGATAGR